jgi:phosphatidylinositol 3-kinase
VQENFQLNKTDEEAMRYFRDLITTSMNAMFPQLFETVHKWAQYMRK